METTSDSETRKPTVVAIGGGKGGVGKSVIAANVALVLASGGARVAVVDADLGGANLQTLLGLSSPALSLADFISHRADRLEDVMTPTDVDGLWLVAGSHALLEMANPKSAQKGRVLRHLARLPVEYVVLDLGAGSSFHVLDFFLWADCGGLVVVPEATSVENAYHFLKAAFYRRLKFAEPRARVRPVVERAMREKEERGIRSPRHLIDEVKRIDGDAGRALESVARRFRPGIVVNRAAGDADGRLADDIATACRDYFGSEAIVLGTLPVDGVVPRSIQQRTPIVEMCPACPFSHAVRGVAAKLEDELGGGNDG